MARASLSLRSAGTAAGKKAGHGLRDAGDRRQVLRGQRRNDTLAHQHPTDPHQAGIGSDGHALTAA